MQTNIKKIVVLTAMLSLPALGNAQLEVLDNTEMQSIEARGGVDLGFILRLNQKDSAGNLSSQASYNTTDNGSYASGQIDPRQTLDCENRQFCRLAVAFNNRFSELDTDASSTTTVDNKQWLVLKGLQGYIDIPKMSLDAANVTDIKRNGGEAEADNNRVALKIGFTANNPIKINHLGFESLSIEVGSSDNKAGNQLGYLNMADCTAGSSLCPVEGYSNGKYINAGFDTGREIGFLGVDIHGNLALNSNIYLFSCSSRGNC